MVGNFDVGKSLRTRRCRLGLGMGEGAVVETCDTVMLDLRASSSLAFSSHRGWVSASVRVGLPLSFGECWVTVTVGWVKDWLGLRLGSIELGIRFGEGWVETCEIVLLHLRASSSAFSLG